MVLHFILAFCAGILVKTVDWLDDVKKSAHPAKHVLAILYGLLLGYIIGTSTFSIIFLSALIAQVFARKVDTTAHRIGFVVAALSLLYFGFPTFDFWLFLGFLVLAFFDEMDYIGKLRPLVEYRPLLKVGALLPAIIGVWDYFLGIMAFDLGYELFKFAVKEREEEKKAEPPPVPKVMLVEKAPEEEVRPQSPPKRSGTGRKIRNQKSKTQNP